MTRRRRLIEVAFPLEEVSAHSRREKNVRHGHISTLHIWWARRPLAACRAFIYASLVDDPETDIERDVLLKEVADLASWDAVRKPDQVVRNVSNGGSGLTGHELLERARRRILTSNGGAAPRLLDPFAGGGAIPLEALRLGCEVEASDLNPVAVLILKGTVEYPQKYGRPLAEQRKQFARCEQNSIAGLNGEVPGYIREAGQLKGSAFGEDDAVAAYEKNPLVADVRYWGNWMLERARTELAEFYPPDPDGSAPVAYLWSRTVPCPNCQAEMPLIRQYWLARKDKKKIALKPVIDQVNRRVDFEIVEGPNVTGDPGEATTSRGDTICLVCRQIVKAEYVQEIGKHRGLGDVMTAVILEPLRSGGKRYRKPTDDDQLAVRAAEDRVARLSELSGLPPVPDEPLAEDPRNIWCVNYGLDSVGKLFGKRQSLALATLSRLVPEALMAIAASKLDADYAKAVASYLGLSVSRYVEFSCTLARWKVDAESIVGALARQALPMVWDYAEHAATTEKGGSFAAMFERVAQGIEAAVVSNIAGTVIQRDARVPATSHFDFILTDPPYYDSINYANLSDFFYAWMHRSMADIHPDIFDLPLSPKIPQIVMDVYAPNIDRKCKDRNNIARQRYVDGMAASFRAMSSPLTQPDTVGVVFAHTDGGAWATLIEGLLASDLAPVASWPIDTEMESKVAGHEQARLATSVWMSCRTRSADAGDAFLGDVLTEMRPVIRDRLLDFWARGIRGADFFISAIGPGLSVFGRHKRVLQPDGSEVSVREFLDLVRRESTQVALEQVLGGTDLGLIDPTTRQYVTWVWSYSRAPLDTGEALALCLATGADYRDVVRDGSIAIETREASKKIAKLRTVKERGEREESLGIGTAARPAPLVDQLQCAAWLWGQNRPNHISAQRAGLGETRWRALRTLGQAIAECLPPTDEDRRLINGLLGSASASGEAPAPGVAPDRTHTMQMFDSEV